MKKTIAMLIIAPLIILCMCGCKTKARETTTTSEVYATSFEATTSVVEEVIDVPIQTFDSIIIETSDNAASIIAEYENYVTILNNYIQDNCLNKNLNEVNIQ